MIDVIEYAGKRYTPLFQDLFRSLSDLERDRLRDSMHAMGALMPISVDDETDPVGLIDGQHRLELAVELNLPASEVRFVVITGMTMEEKRSLAVALNDARRQMTPEDRAALAKRLIEEGKSKRQAAKEMGVGEATVRRDTKDSGASGGAPERRTGGDGKRYPKAPLSQVALEARQAQALQMYEAGRTIAEIASALGVSTGTAHTDIGAAKMEREVEAAPEAVEIPCPRCKDCPECRGKRWITVGK